MQPRAAWIDHCDGTNALFAMQLRWSGVDLAVASTLDEFLREHDLNDFPVLMYHPGREEQHKIVEVIQKYPKLTVALITAPGSGGDYRSLKSDIPVLTYDAEHAEKFIREHQ
jgi:hypothetical protein